MSGFEVPVLFAIVPLVFKVSGSYKTTSELLQRYAKYDIELKNLEISIHSRKVIFHNEWFLLLRKITDWSKNDATSRLQWGYDPDWATEELNQKCMEYLGHSHNSVLEIVGAVYKSFTFIESKANRFHDAMEQHKMPSSNMSFARGGWFAFVKAKADLSLSRSMFKEILTQLDELNQRLSITLNQVARIQESDRQLSNSALSSKSTKSSNLLRDTTLRIYDSLYHACASHEEHLLYLGLTDDTALADLRFDMALEPVTNASPVDFHGPARFVVMKSVDGCSGQWPTFSDEQDENSISERLNSVKRQFEPCSDDVASQKKRKTDPLKDTSNVPAIGQQQGSGARTADLHSTIQLLRLERYSSSNLTANRDFCSQIRKSPFREITEELGYLGESETRFETQLRVFNFPTPFQSTYPETLKSLFLNPSPDDYRNRLLPPQILAFAKKLASAVLQYHLTPILNEDWGSEDVLFFVSESKSKRQVPYLQTKIPPIVQNPQSSSHISAIIRNRYIFSLGCILIELAHEKPISDLQERPATADTSLYYKTRFSTADRICKGMLGILGIAYMEVVRKCIHCDFGKGFDLSSPAVRDAFEHDVVGELERLERIYAGLFGVPE